MNFCESGQPSPIQVTNERSTSQQRVLRGDLDFASDVNMKSDPLSLFRVIETTGLVLLWSRGRLPEPGPQCVSSRRYRNTRLIAVGNLKADWAGECRSVAGGEVQEEISHRCARGPVRSVLLGGYRVIIYKRHFTVLVFQGLNPQRSAVCYCGRLVQYPRPPNWILIVIWGRWRFVQQKGKTGVAPPPSLGCDLLGWVWSKGNTSPPNPCFVVFLHVDY